ncbi:hypothetical protein [Pectobacterium versatile]|uniref:hypothetical protein n=1 Tax=Pectobacterium versatile TaxID=2488639 RepID=UPI00102EDEB7|nr:MULTISPECIES: hypothetical protein [Pectobacterium]MBA0164903.1 hypothetical protein [Pectobacterium versatile]MBD0845427.1 hypothetical protein [Pectobacterium carotovorum subsp. carotovorum]MBK4825988.1 hypothetical protein [Pectobacterium carotovorum subsp. carotovorum]MBN3060113.1 hypothetical protein [Pectobacterium versatile]MBQ4776297.1 hypothetical protein [Pectobacterium versatile]
MIKFLGKYRKWVSSVINERLLGVRGLVYELDTPDFYRPQKLQFIFSNTEKLFSLMCSKDGSSLVLTDSPIQESDLGEYGKEVIMELSNITLFIDYIGKRLLEIYSIFSSVEDAFMGIKFVFEGDLNLIIVNFGDEINIFNSLPSSYEHDEGIKYQSL